MKEIRISDVGEGLQIDIKGIDPLEAMNFLTVAMVQVLQRIKPQEEATIIKPNAGQAMNMCKNRLN